MKLTFIGNEYTGVGYRFDKPGEYEVDEAKAEQLLRDFPDQFASVDGDQKSEPEPKPVNLSKMNRENLETHARSIGMTQDLSTYDTNKALIQAIENHQNHKEG